MDELRITTVHMAIASQNSVTAVVRTWTFMVIFCFAGYAAGSCLSYGHSCWGAHGKRSGGHNTQYVLPLKGLNEVQQGIPSITKEQLMMSRLIGRPLGSNKYRGRWDRFLKMKSNFPEHWNDVTNNEPVWNQNNDDDIGEGKKKHMNDEQDMMESMNNEKKEIPDILLITNNEENEHGSKPQNIEFFKFLVNSNTINY